MRVFLSRFALSVAIFGLVSSQDPLSPTDNKIQLDRPLQFNACTFQPPWWKYNESATYVASLSQVSACLSSFQLDPNNVTQYLESMKNITEDFYIFVDQAVDPLKTSSLQTPLDYGVYNGTGYGQVDVLGELQSFLDTIKQTGNATLDVLMKVNAVFNSLFDAHISVNDALSVTNMLTSSLYLYSGEMANEANPASSVTIQHVYPTDNDEFVLEAWIVYENSEDKTPLVKRIQTIGGMSPLEWYAQFSLQPLGRNQAFKSLGPRVAAVLAALQRPLFVFFGYYSGDNPNYSNYLEDSYVVEYQDGTRTTWNLMVDVPFKVAANQSKAEIEQSLLQPGFLYQDFAQAKKTVLETITPPSMTERNNSQGRRDLLSTAASMTHPSRALQEEVETAVNFTMFGPSVGYVVTDEYAVYKIQTFSTQEDPDLPSNIAFAWELMSNEAAQKGVTKLIIDLNGNGGGDISLGYLLATLLYPDVDWQDFANPNDQLLSDAMMIFWGDIVPLVENITTTIARIPQQ